MLTSGSRRPALAKLLHLAPAAVFLLLVIGACTDTSAPTPAPEEENENENNGPGENQGFLPLPGGGVLLV